MKRELLMMTHRRVLGIGFPALRHLGPLLTMTGVALAVVAVMNDMGTALLLYGIFLAMVQAAAACLLYAALFVLAVGRKDRQLYTARIQELAT